MKTTKRFVALLMAVVMVFALSAVALADTNRGVNYLDGEPFETFTINKTIYLKNKNTKEYTLPKIDFTYKIEGAKDNDLNYDAHAGGLGQVHTGIADGLLGAYVADDGTHSQTPGTTTVLTFDERTVQFSANPGEAYVQPITLTVDLTKYNGTVKNAGIYRYKITDITDREYLESVGVIRPKDYNDTYVSDDGEAKPGKPGKTICFVDLYIAYDSANDKCTVGAAVVSEYDEEVPDRDSNGAIVCTDGTTYDPKDVRVDEDAKVYTVRDGFDYTGGAQPTYPTDYTKDTGKTATMVEGLHKTDDVYSEKPNKPFTDTDGDGLPDTDENHKPLTTDSTVVEPLIDDEGNIIATDGTKYPQPEYSIDSTGKIVHDDEHYPTPSVPLPENTYAQYIGKYDYEGDLYECYNVCLKKSIKGPMADRTHKFPFDITVNNKTKETTPNDLAYVGGGEPKLETVTTVTANLADKETYVLEGLNPHATLNFKETNNTTFHYAVSVNGQGVGEMDMGEYVIAYTDESSGTPVAKAISTLNSTNNEFEEQIPVVTFTNTQTVVSPTGVVLRFAPYILMLGAAFFFVALSRRRREQENA